MKRRLVAQDRFCTTGAQHNASFMRPVGIQHLCPYIVTDAELQYIYFYGISSKA